VLAEYHGEGDRNSPIVQLEYREMLQEISKTGSDKRWWDYRELFNTHEARYRSMIVLLLGRSASSSSDIVWLLKICSILSSIGRG
jgi:hypothetical protein